MNDKAQMTMTKRAVTVLFVICALSFVIRENARANGSQGVAMETHCSMIRALCGPRSGVERNSGFDYARIMDIEGSAMPDALRIPDPFCSRVWSSVMSRPRRTRLPFGELFRSGGRSPA
jgi:hypothetical protein